MAERDLTRNEQVVLRALTKAGQAMSAYDVLDTVRDSGLRAPAQVYRALDKLSQRHLVHRIESMNAFVACAHDHVHDGKDHTPACDTHDAVVFCICEDCGDIEELRFDRQISSLQRALGDAGFEAHELTFEIKGRCKACCRV